MTNSQTLLSGLIDWLTALWHISTERLLEPRNVAKKIWSRFVAKYNCVWGNADWPTSWHISTKSYQWQWKCGCSLTSCPGHYQDWFYTAYLWTYTQGQHDWFNSNCERWSNLYIITVRRFYLLLRSTFKASIINKYSFQQINSMNMGAFHSCMLQSERCDKELCVNADGFTDLIDS